MCISLQCVVNFLVVLTRQPVSARVFALPESLAALQVWLTGDDRAAIARGGRQVSHFPDGLQ